MKTLKLIQHFLFAATLSLTLIVHAADKNSTSKNNEPVATSPESQNTTSIEKLAIPSVPKWRASLTSYYYELHGHKADDRHLYDFKSLNARIDLANISYLTDSGWTMNALFQHYELYTETIFPAANNLISYDRTVGAGDTYLSLIAPAHYTNGWLLIPDVGVSIPTGNINNKSGTVGLAGPNLAYNAQHGSGTYDALLGGTALYAQPGYTLGSRIFADIRTGKNSNDYTLGNMYKLDFWYDYNTKYGITPRLVGMYKYKEAIRGEDASRNHNYYTNTYLKNDGDEFYYHPQSNWDVSAAVKYTKAINQYVSLSAEVGIPVYQGNSNWDNSEVISKYFGDVSVSGAW